MLTRKHGTLNHSEANLRPFDGWLDFLGARQRPRPGAPGRPSPAGCWSAWRGRTRTAQARGRTGSSRFLADGILRSEGLPPVLGRQAQAMRLRIAFLGPSGVEWEFPSKTH